MREQYLLEIEAIGELVAESKCTLKQSQTINKLLDELATTINNRIKNTEDLPGFNSTEFINTANERFEQLKHKGLHWRSFYIGWVECRINVLRKLCKSKN